MRELRRQWPVATVQAGLLLVQFTAIWPPSGRQFAAWALIAITCAAALSARRHVVATVCACASILVTTALFSGPGRAVFLPTTGTDGLAGFDRGPGPLSLAENAAVLVLVVVVTRTARPPLAVGLVAAVALTGAHAAVLRSGYLGHGVEEILLSVLLGVIAVGSGVLLRVRDRERAAASAAAVERTQREERLDLARELHDVVAHHVTGMLVQAQAALVVSEQDREAAHRMLPGIITGGTDAVGAMRRLVGTLRDDAAGTATSDLASDLEALVEGARDHGLPVKARIDLPEPVPPELGRSVLRLVQEALTNVRKHARDASVVEVDVRLTRTAVRLSVVDNGTASTAHSGGFGLVGMRERVDLLGGRFYAGAARSGWLVTAELPLVAHR